MQHGLKALALTALLAGPVTANATLYSFSYTFGNGHHPGAVVTGSFEGTDNGIDVTGISNISVFYNGLAFNGNGSLYFSSYFWNQNPLYGDHWLTNDGVVSFDASRNNFMFVDSDFPLDFSYTNYFFFVFADYRERTQVFYDGRPMSTDDPGMRENWILTRVSVPEPSTLALFGLGLAGLGFARRRKLN